MSELHSLSPWDGKPVWSGVADEHLPQVVEQAAAVWAAGLPTPARIRDLLLRLSAGFIAEKKSAVDLLIREAGKTEADAVAEADLLVRKIELTLGAGLSRTPLAADPTRFPADWHGPSTLWRPRGVALCVGPFNFPLHLLNGLVVPALAVGCPVIAKPSERCPGLGAWYRERIVEAGLGDYVQVVLGGPSTVQALASSPVIATVAAVGSRGMGVALAKLLSARPEAVLALELGGVNHALVCADADLKLALPVIADGAWRMAGQRCTATRIVHVPRSLADDVIERLRVLTTAWLPNGTPQAAMGPMIQVAERVRFQAVFRSSEPGSHLLAGNSSGVGAFADPILLRCTNDIGRGSARYHAEHFGPYLILDVYDDEEQAVTRMRANQLRLSAAVWTRDVERFKQLAPRLPYGLVNWNSSTAGARSDQPFGGCGLSGNGRPAAIAAGAIFADETVIA